MKKEGKERMEALEKVNIEDLMAGGRNKRRKKKTRKRKSRNKKGGDPVEVFMVNTS